MTVLDRTRLIGRLHAPHLRIRGGLRPRHSRPPPVSCPSADLPGLRTASSAAL